MGVGQGDKVLKSGEEGRGSGEYLKEGVSSYQVEKKIKNESGCTSQKN